MDSTQTLTLTRMMTFHAHPVQASPLNSAYRGLHWNVPLTHHFSALFSLPETFFSQNPLGLVNFRSALISQLKPSSLEKVSLTSRPEGIPLKYILWPTTSSHPPLILLTLLIVVCNTWVSSCLMSGPHTKPRAPQSKCMSLLLSAVCFARSKPLAGVRQHSINSW